MAFEVLREFVSILRFRLDDAGLVEMNTRLNDARANIKSSIGGMENLARGVRRAGMDLTLFLSAPMALFVKESMQAAAMMEKYTVQYSVLVGSMKEAKQLTKDLIMFESKTPFTVPQVMKFAQQLLQAQEPAKNLVKQLKLIGDVTLGDPQKMDRTIYALSQVRQLGYLTGMERRQFTEALVPMSRALEQLTGKTGQEVTKMISKHQISAAMVQQALELIGKERLGALEKASQTLTGLWSTLVSAVWRLHAAFGQMIERSIAIKAILHGLIGAFNMLAWIFNHIPAPIGLLITLFAALLILLGPLLWIAGALAGAYINLSVATAMLGITTEALSVVLVKLNFQLFLLRAWFVSITPEILPFIGLLLIATSAALILQDALTYLFFGKQYTVWPAWYKFWEDIGAKIHRVAVEIDKICNLFDILTLKTTRTVAIPWLMKQGKGAIDWAFPKEGEWTKKLMSPQPQGGEWTDRLLPQGNSIGRTISNIFHINMPVPAGTTEQQKQHLSTHIKDLFDQKLYENLNAAAVQ